jgi:hypothetical protein
MSMRPRALPEVPEQAMAVARAAFLGGRWRCGHATSWVRCSATARLSTLRVPKTVSVQVTPHVRTHEGRRPDDHADGCRDG